ncbi:MAG TPA: LysR family transcriptional regulator [Bacillota bacterium]|nr:LysR family transcriptional regulator [Bacillota bacterium]
MNITNLKAFIETVQASSISKAADNLHLTQPAVSMQIQNLENSIGYQLLIRSNRGVQLTDYGKIFFAYAQSFLTLWDNLQHDLKTVASGDTTPLHVGTCPAIGQYALPCALYLFKQKFPQIRVLVQSSSTLAVTNDLRDRTLEVGFVEGTPQSADLMFSEVLRSELILVASPDKAYSSITLSQLSEVALILAPEDSDIRRSLNRSLTAYAFDESFLKPFLELDGLEGIKSAVISGHGYSFLPYFSVKKELFSGELKRVNLSDANLEITFSMVWRKNEKVSEHCQNFMDFICSQGAKSFC